MRIKNRYLRFGVWEEGGDIWDLGFEVCLMSAGFAGEQTGDELDGKYVGRINNG